MKYPSVSVVVPVKGSQRTIRQLTDSLLDQDYPGNIEVILVGDYDDPTWEPIIDQIDCGLIHKVECEVVSLGRDANSKRNIGLSLARGEVLAMTDSDMVMPPNWVSRGVEYILEGHHGVAGSMSSVHGDFWGHYVDRNMLGSKTPRMTDPYLLDRDSFGKAGFKPPVTANFFFTRELWSTVGELDPNFVYTYEDYEWFRRVIDGGFSIYCANDLTAAHYHRQGFRDLRREYMRCGQGCMEYIFRHSHCRFAHARLAHLFIVYVVLLAGLVAFRRSPQKTMAFGLATTLAVSATSGFKLRSAPALTYPLVTLFLGMTFAAGMTRRLLQGSELPVKSVTVSYTPEALN